MSESNRSTVCLAPQWPFFLKMICHVLGGSMSKAALWRSVSRSQLMVVFLIWGRIPVCFGWSS